MIASEFKSLKRSSISLLESEEPEEEFSIKKYQTHIEFLIPHVIQPKKIKHALSNEIGSGFYVSKFRHVVTNHHVVNGCKKITVGDSINKQIPATLVASDSRNDLAILQTISMEMASADTKTFIQNLSIEIVPIVSGGLIRSEDVNGGEEILVMKRLVQGMALLGGLGKQRNCHRAM